MPITIDSGFRRGTDVFKALALGARIVFIGRAFNYAAAIAGHPSVEHAIGLLTAELHRNMSMLGLNALSEIDGAKLVPMAVYWAGRPTRPAADEAPPLCAIAGQG